MTYIGIDPGVSGAIAIIRNSAVTIHDWTDDVRSLYQMLPSAGTVVLEQVHFDRRDDGHKKSAEKLIRTHQTWTTLIQLKGLDLIDLYPVQWRSSIGFKGGADKEAALEYALSLYPGVQSCLFYKSRNGRWKRNHNRAEALLMAHAALIKGRAIAA